MNAPRAFTGGPITRGDVAFVRFGKTSAEFCLVAGITSRGGVKVQPFDRPCLTWGAERTVPAEDVDDILSPREVKHMQAYKSLPEIDPEFLEAS